VSDHIDPNWTPVGTLPTRMKLQSSRTKYIVLLIACAIFVAGALWAFLDGVREAWVWGCFALFGSGCLVSLYLLFKPSTLILSRDGFEQKHFSTTTSFKWDEISEFGSTTLRTGLFAKQEFVTFTRVEDEGKVVTEISKKLLGGGGSLADTFGMKSKDLAVLMTQFRDRFLEEGAESQSSAAPQSSGTQIVQDDGWRPVNDGDFVSHTPGAERAPIVKWGLSFLLLTSVAGGALWLVSKTIVSDELVADRPRLELPTNTGDEQEEEPVKKSSDEEAWVRALEKDTLEGYREYLELFPNGKFKDDAQEQIDAYDNRAWETAERRNTIAGYEDYLEAWPEGLHASKARERIAEMKARAEAIAKDAAERAAQEAADWDRASRENTVASYESYLAKHRSGANAAEAQNRIDRLKATAADEAAWTQAKTANRADAYQQYLTSFPQGAHVPEAIAAIEQLKPAAGRVFQDCDVCPPMVSIASGNASLGAGDNEADARPNEKPQRPVTFTNMFAMGVTEVTFAQWEACATAGGCPARPSDNGWGGGKRPVINVSWDDAQKYVSWLSSKSGFSYALPSEAQWEYAARGGETGVWVGGSPTALCAFANGAAQESGLKWANNACTDPSSDRTLPVGTLGSNKFGLKDMIGNVAEWTLDCNTLNLRDAPTNGEADQRGSCNQRSVRGGSWFSGPADVRFAARLMQRRGDSNDFTGFRVVRKIGN